MAEQFEKEQIQSEQALVEKGLKSIKKAETYGETADGQIQGIGDSRIRSLLDVFEPPLCALCGKCQKRRADRICVNKECGNQKFMQIICGKCHSDEHALATRNPELDIEEYLSKFVIFLETKQLCTNFVQEISGSTQKSSYVDGDQLEVALQDINMLRQYLNVMKQMLNDTISKLSVAKRSGDSNIEQIIEGALRKGNQLKDVNDHLAKIKKYVTFEKNQFGWKEQAETRKQFDEQLEVLKEIQQKMKQSISNSLKGTVLIHLRDLRMAASASLSKGYSEGEVGVIGNEIEVASKGQENWQFYLNHVFEVDIKYRIRFRFCSKSTGYVMVGVMPLALASNKWVHTLQDQPFFKRFFVSSSMNECNRVIKGNNFSNFTKQDDVVEMRVHIAGDYVDFADYPNHYNVNASQLSSRFQDKEKGQYVFAVALFNQQAIAIQEVAQIPEIELY